jgi:hypothetical protein
LTKREGGRRYKLSESAKGKGKQDSIGKGKKKED